MLQVADVMEDCLVHAFLHQSPNCVVTWILELYPFNLYTELVRTLSTLMNTIIYKQWVTRALLFLLVLF